MFIFTNLTELLLCDSVNFGIPAHQNSQDSLATLLQRSRMLLRVAQKAEVSFVIVTLCSETSQHPSSSSSLSNWMISKVVSAFALKK